MSPGALFVMAAALAAEAAVVALILSQVAAAAVLTVLAVACTCRTLHLNDQCDGRTTR